MGNINIKKFEFWLKKRGASILPLSNEYEALRFKGRNTGVIYTSGKVANGYTQDAINAFLCKSKWNGAPVKTGRKNTYKKEKIKLLDRDGHKCYLCQKELGYDITLEHLNPISRGGKNDLDNMVLMHEKCNQSLENLPLIEKLNKIISRRLKNKTL